MESLASNALTNQKQGSCRADSERQEIQHVVIDALELSQLTTHKTLSMQPYLSYQIFCDTKSSEPQALTTAALYPCSSNFVLLPFA